jgi:hypothetical protein
MAGASVVEETKFAMESGGELQFPNHATRKTKMGAKPPSLIVTPGKVTPGKK